LGLNQVGVDPDVTDPSALVASLLYDLVNDLLFLKMIQQQVSKVKSFNKLVN
jgi:hypothetical protein